MAKMATVPAKITEKLLRDADEMIEDGYYASRSELIRDAIRDLLKSSKAERLEQAIKEDVD